MNNFLLQQLITAKSQVQSVESQNNRLQHKLKDVNDEFRSRLIKYVQDIAVSDARARDSLMGTINLYVSKDPKILRWISSGFYRFCAN